MASAKQHIVDFSNVKDGGGNFNKKRIPAGDYLGKIVKIEDAAAKDDTPQILFTIKIIKHPSSILPYYCKLQENQLWKLRNILIAGGLSVPKKKTKVDPNRLLNKEIGVTIDDAEWDGKDQSEIAAVFPAAELGDDPDDDEVVDDDGDDDDEDVSLDDDVAEDDEEEVVVEDDEEEVDAEDEYTSMERLDLRKALKKLDPDAKTTTAMSDDDIRALIRGIVSGDVEAEDEEEEAPAPKKAAAKTTKKKSSDVSDDELDELDIDNM